MWTLEETLDVKEWNDSGGAAAITSGQCLPFAEVAAGNMKATGTIEGKLDFGVAYWWRIGMCCQLYLYPDYNYAPNMYFYIPDAMATRASIDVDIDGSEIISASLDWQSNGYYQFPTVNGNGGGIANYDWPL